MSEQEERNYQSCYAMVPMCQPIMIQQIVGHKIACESFNLRVCVPRRKPAIEQVIDVFVRKLIITRVEVLTNKVIICGHFEVKAIYVACLPDQPVHAIEVRHTKFSLAVDIPGARCGMDADASVIVEFVDYECDKTTRAYWHKYQDYQETEHCKEMLPKKPVPPPKCEPEPWPCTAYCTRKFEVMVVLRADVKVLCDREVFLQHKIPFTPKG